MDEKLGTELVSKNKLSLINDNVYFAGEHIKLPSILTREVHIDHHRIT